MNTWKYILYCVIMGLSVICINSNDLNAFDRDAVRAYVTEYWNSRNFAYNYYESDCANFVSQCLKNGGLFFRSGQNAYIDDKGCIVRAREWPYYLPSIPGVIIRDFSVNDNVPSETAIGDIILLRDPLTDAHFHTMIVADKNVGYELSTITVAAHMKAWGQVFTFKGLISFSIL